MKKLSLALVLSLLILPTLTTFAAPQTADEIIEKHIAAIGGRAALAKITSRKGVGTVTLTTDAGDLTGPAELYSKAPNKSRAFLSIDLTPVGMSETMTINQRFNGTDGWATNSMQGETQITGNQLDNMKNSMFPSSMLNYKEQGTKIDVLAKETVAGKEMIVLQVTPKTGSAAKVYLDSQTYLVVRTVSRISSPEVGELEQTSEQSDYRAVDGVQVAFKVVNSSPVQKVTITLKTVEHNVVMDDAMFNK
jgi:outer membrane lipoprotein-sorting protein